MPHMGGFERLRGLADSSFKVPSTIMAVSSLAPSELAAKERLLPGIQFFSKPVDRGRLGALLGVTDVHDGIDPVA